MRLHTIQMNPGDKINTEIWMGWAYRDHPYR